MPLLDSYYKVPEAAIYLRVRPETVKRLCQRGRIPAEKVHNTWLIQKEKLEEFAATYRNPRRLNAGASAASLKQDRGR
ncbi:MAG: helix-turn-helix domain-containing protein [Chloroflexi bacterium]|nr:helix-turn-helix domain-containing protein [Chloroflexota bacterium]